MKKINLLKIPFYLTIIFSICYLKYSIYPIESYTQYIYEKNIPIEQSLMGTILFLIPFMFIFYVMGKRYFYKLNRFEVRYKNRKRFTNYMLFSLIIETILFSSFVFLSQSILLTLIEKRIFVYDNKLIIFLLQYIIENLFIVCLILLFSLLFKNFIYSYLLVIIIIAIGLILNFEFKMIPFFNLFYGIRINPITIFFIILSLLVIKIYYEHSDVGGVELWFCK